ncbi:hypothetical protein BD410DRAFT_801189 [Rickenella mellea]|uniref:LsmAD domain-containing protein n=1 Tax=Rickenella mellea TaxID=50990 RepID=A0A4Y7QF94_9AGAM|nr:hypothetical protein BD410DRAFT_801189 [Rickenella mellea]
MASTTTRPSKGAPVKKAPDATTTTNATTTTGTTTPRRTAWGARGASPLAQIPPFSPNANNTRGVQNGFPPLGGGGPQNGKMSPMGGGGGGGPSEERERLLASLAGSIGSTIIVSLRSGNNRYEGTLTTVKTSPAEDASLTLKDAKDLSVPGAPIKDTLTIAAGNIGSFTPGPPTQPSNKVDSFRTDTEISRATQQKRERELQAWQPDAPLDTTGSTSPPPIASGPTTTNNNISNANSINPTAPSLPITASAAAQSAFQRGDDVTFGPNAAAGGAWDQFAANERLFGVTTQFDEDVYTTRLDRSAKDFREKERRAERIAAEITGAVTTNSHIAEERGLVVDDSGVNEEDKYGAVVRSANAYVPPGARRANSNTSIPPMSPPPSAPAQAPTTPLAPSTPTPAPSTKETQKGGESKPEVPKVSVNAPDGTEKTLPGKTTTPPAGGAASGPAGAAGTKAPADALPAFRDFVTNEKQRLTQKRQALVKNEMDKRMAELVKFSQNFKLNKPIPDDLVPILAKDEKKQREIIQKSTADAESAKARAIATAGSSSGTAQQPQSKPTLPATKSNDATARKQTTAPAVSPSPAGAASGKQGGGMSASKSSAAMVSSGGGGGASASGSGSGSGSGNAAKANGGGMTASATAPRVGMVIQTIPPFRGSAKKASVSNVDVKGGSSTGSSSAAGGGAAGVGQPPMSPTTAQRLNVNASSFRPNPKAAAFTPVVVNGSSGSGSPSAKVSPKAKAESPPGPQQPNPFFGTQIIKKNPPVTVKDDFNPFKYNKVAEASATNALWPYSGKRYMMMFPPPPPLPPPQASPHMAPHHGPPPPPPPSYDEDAAAQAAQAAAARGYALYYPYQYPGQPPHPQMIVPPGFVPSPYMQPIPYPQHMGPHNGQPMYAPPPMGQMPPPQTYMPPPPPPGAYPPPQPNGAGPRPSMPPTPIAAHAHPYYHQSPQRMISFDQYSGKMFTLSPVQHAVPYPMMMPPPGPNGPPHPYDGGPPPVPMGGVGHA